MIDKILLNFRTESLLRSGKGVIETVTILGIDEKDYDNEKYAEFFDVIESVVMETPRKLISKEEQYIRHIMDLLVNKKMVMFGTVDSAIDDIRFEIPHFDEELWKEFTSKFDINTWFERTGRR